MQGLNPWKLLTDEEKAVFEQMHEYAVKNGIGSGNPFDFTTNKVLDIAMHFAMQKHMDVLSDKMQSTIKGYMTDLADRIKNEHYKAPGLDISVLETFLNNFKIFEDGAKQALLEKSDKKA